MQLNKEVFHQLEGERIYFKPLAQDEAKAIHSYASDPDVSRYIGWKLMNTLEDTKKYIDEMIRREEANTFLYASIVLKSTKKVIGTAMLFNFDHEANHAELGYVLHGDYWGKGYGTETVALITNFGFGTLELHKIHGRVVGKNIGSIRVLEKNGFTLEGRFKDYYFIDGMYCDGLFFGKL